MKLMMLTLVLIFPYVGFSHSGNTDSYGCHTNHKTGDYHCHNSKGGYDGSDISSVYIASAILLCALVIVTVKPKYDISENRTHNSELNFRNVVMFLPYTVKGKFNSNSLSYGLKVGVSF